MGPTLEVAKTTFALNLTAMGFSPTLFLRLPKLYILRKALKITTPFIDIVRFEVIVL